MKFAVNLFESLLLLILVSCSGSRYLEMTSHSEEALRGGDYRTALGLSEEIIGERETRGKEAPARVYSIAGISACELGEYPKSLAYLEQAQKLGYSGADMDLCLARDYRQVDNLSKEISALEAYLDHNPRGEDAADVRNRLFQTCVESENYDLAGKLWMEMDSAARENVGNLETWLELNRMQGNDQVCDSLAQRLLVLHSDDVKALEWLGKSYFWKAENSYQYQMKTYRENRTRKQYAILLDAFKQLSADYRKSRDYFLKLYKLDPDPAYAEYLGNIFTRLEDREKAAYYKKRAD